MSIWGGIIRRATGRAVRLEDSFYETVFRESAEGTTGPLQCYAHGAELFKKYGNDIEMAKKLLESYPSNLKK